MLVDIQLELILLMVKMSEGYLWLRFFLNTCLMDPIVILAEFDASFNPRFSFVCLRDKCWKSLGGTLQDLPSS